MASCLVRLNWINTKNAIEKEVISQAVRFGAGVVVILIGIAVTKEFWTHSFLIHCQGQRQVILGLGNIMFAMWQPH